MKNFKEMQRAFTLAEVTVAKRVSDKTCLQEFVEACEPKAPTRMVSKFCAFTLAEVLITLAIIGVVAALTIPTVVKNYQEKVLIVSLKKFYSTSNQALSLAQVQNGPIDSWHAYNGGTLDDVLNTFAPIFKGVKTCMREGCWAKNTKMVSGNADILNLHSGVSGFYKMRLADGTNISFEHNYEKCNSAWGTSKALKNVCTLLIVDTNGDKLPNQWGRDIFFFYITKYGVVPFGTQKDTKRFFPSYCTKTCTTKDCNHGCAGWVLANENMDYFKCNDLSWSGKRRCD